MKHRRRGGLSFLELVLAMSITFLAISFLLPLFMSGSTSAGRSRQLSAANFMAQGLMERLLATPVDQISAGSHHLSGEYDGYSYRVELLSLGDFDGDGVDDSDMKMLELSITTPSGAVTVLNSLRQGVQPFYGVTASADGKRALLSTEVYDYPAHWDLTAWQMNNPYPPMPGGRIGDMCSDTTWTNIYAIDTNGQGIRKLDTALSAWGPLLKPPAGLATEFTGMACDANAAVIWIADIRNDALWRYDTATAAWSGPIVATPALKDPKGVAVDAAGTAVWIADEGNNAVRRYHASTSAWDPTLYTNPDMAEPRGIAVKADGTEIYVADPERLHQLVLSSSAWCTEHAPGKVRSDFPAGMVAAPTGDIVYLTTERGSFWMFEPVAGSWTYDEVWWPGDSVI